jgi:hypothetical protein
MAAVMELALHGALRAIAMGRQQQRRRQPSLLGPGCPFRCLAQDSEGALPFATVRRHRDVRSAGDLYRMTHAIWAASSNTNSTFSEIRL